MSNEEMNKPTNLATETENLTKELTEAKGSKEKEEEIMKAKEEKEFLEREEMLSTGKKIIVAFAILNILFYAGSFLFNLNSERFILLSLQVILSIYLVSQSKVVWFLFILGNCAFFILGILGILAPTPIRHLFTPLLLVSVISLIMLLCKPVRAYMFQDV